MRGRAGLARAGEWDEAAEHCRRAHELGEQVGRSEVAFDGAHLARGRRCARAATWAAAETELAEALDICERAGLIAQSVEAISARAVVLALAGRDDQAQAAAEEAERLADRLHYPVGRRRQGRGRGRLRRRPGRGRSEDGGGAERSGVELGRPLDAARCLLVQAAHARRLATPMRARELAAKPPPEYESLGVAGPGRARPRARRLG